jgi:hypothetical protein
LVKGRYKLYTPFEKSSRRDSCAEQKGNDQAKPCNHAALRVLGLLARPLLSCGGQEDKPMPSQAIPINLPLSWDFSLPVGPAVIVALLAAILIANNLGH